MEIEDFPILIEFKDVLPYGFPRLPLKRDLDFTIDFIPRAIPI